MKQLVFISFENNILTNVHMHVKCIYIAKVNFKVLSRQSPNIYIFVSLKISVIDLYQTVLNMSASENCFTI